MFKNKNIINYLGILGVISFLSYFIAVCFSPLAYPGYDWVKQAVSDLSADGAPSLGLWRILSTFYSECNVLACVIACIVAYFSKHNKLLKAGIYTFTLMNVVSAVGYRLFPLSEAGYAGTFQDIMHVYVVTVGVVLLSIVGLGLCIAGGIMKDGNKFLFVSAIVCLSMMMIGAIGTNAFKSVFGVFERFSTLSAVAFVGVLGIWVFLTPIQLKEE